MIQYASAVGAVMPEPIPDAGRARRDRRHSRHGLITQPTSAAMRGRQPPQPVPACVASPTALDASSRPPSRIARSTVADAGPPRTSTAAPRPARPAASPPSSVARAPAPPARAGRAARGASARSPSRTAPARRPSRSDEPAVAPGARVEREHLLVAVARVGLARAEQVDARDLQRRRRRPRRGTPRAARRAPRRRRAPARPPAPTSP